MPGFESGGPCEIPRSRIVPCVSALSEETTQLFARKARYASLSKRILTFSSWYTHPCTVTPYCPLRFQSSWTTCDARRLRTCCATFSSTSRSSEGGPSSVVIARASCVRGFRYRWIACVSGTGGSIEERSAVWHPTQFEWPWKVSEMFRRRLKVRQRIKKEGSSPCDWELWRQDLRPLSHIDLSDVIGALMPRCACYQEISTDQQGRRHQSKHWGSRRSRLHCSAVEGEAQDLAAETTPILSMNERCELNELRTQSIARSAR